MEYCLARALTIVRLDPMQMIDLHVHERMNLVSLPPEGKLPICLLSDQVESRYKLKRFMDYWNISDTTVDLAAYLFMVRKQLHKYHILPRSDFSILDQKMIHEYDAKVYEHKDILKFQNLKELKRQEKGRGKQKGGGLSFLPSAEFF